MPARLLAALLIVASVAACGTRRATAPDPNAALPPGGATRALSFRAGHLKLSLPAPLRVTRRRPPAVFRTTLPSGAVISALAYDRKEPLPSGPLQLRQARKRLLAATRKRDRSFRLQSARVVRVGGASGLEVLGTQHLSGGRLETRSVHLFTGGTEYVLELIAPHSDFGPADARVFSPMLRTLELT